MCADLPLSPVRSSRRQSWMKMIAAARRDNVAVDSLPVSARVHDLEKRYSGDAEDSSVVKDMIQKVLDTLSARHNCQERVENDISNACEELQATTSELEEIRMILLVTERKCATMQKKNERLEAELEMTRKQLQYVRNELHSRKRRAAGSRLKLSQSFDAALYGDTNYVGNSDNSEVNQLQEKINQLNRELQKKDVLIESERAEHKAQLKDFLTAVKAAERCREETQMQLNSLIKVCRDVSSPDEALWFRIMQKFQRCSKRNALLAWAQSHLTAYPSISVSNFTSDWSDGRAFCAIVHHFRPDMVDRIALVQRGICPRLAMKLAIKLNIQLDSNIFTGGKPDYRQVMAAVFELYKKLELAEEEC